ncbi:transcriptional regulator [Nocardia terpenica]|uniref:Transcriptional regulator n=1 Tax=Nocardia terpenica TaxID=455432 RepID=A0A6G9ZE85_9NOCA|nr:transcriptional regulator [Nocardia terpenica]QIS23426.1 transcriptional regulator [Nocardia terpenica]
MTPLRIEDIALEWSPSAPIPPVPLASPVLPIGDSGQAYRTYAEAVGAIAAPSVFENRPTYQLLHADLAAAKPTMRFGLGCYFDSINVGEAAAHEFALRQRGQAIDAGVRAAVEDPCDPAQRPVNLAISTLTIRREPQTGAKSFLLHWRDPRKVGHAGGLYQVVPVGIFQPSGYAEWNIGHDFSLWRNMVREFSEELRGESEDHGSEQARIDYDSWNFAKHMEQARRDGALTAYCLGLGVDPLSFATDLLTAVIIDAPAFDSLFPVSATSNAEGRVLELQPFTEERVAEILARHPIQAAGRAALRLAITAITN